MQSPRRPAALRAWYPTTSAPSSSYLKKRPARSTERFRQYQSSLAGRRGAAALDSLWEVLRADVRSGRFAAWLAFVAAPGFRPQGVARDDSAAARLQTHIAKSLELPPESLPDAEVLMTLLDGVQLRLLQGDAEPAVRNAYDRLWLGLLSG